MSNRSADNRLLMDKHLRWVPIKEMRVSPQAQRELNKSRVNKIAADLDPEQLGNPTVNLRDGTYWIIDGQHRVWAVKAVLGDDQKMQCWQYEGLSLDEEAEVFLKLNDTLHVDAMSKFKIGVQAGREEESDIDRIVRGVGLNVSREQVGGSIRAVATLRRVYRNGPPTLTRTLVMARDAYGDPGLESSVLDGLGMVTARYNGQLDDADAIRKLSNAHGGVNGLLNRAEQLRKSLGAPKGQCVAAAAVEIVNRGRRGKSKLPDWWAAS